jgi:hypothetical protein
MQLWMDDPSPDDDLPSDIAFGAWLVSLDPLVVLQDLQPAMTWPEKSRLDYMKRRLLRSEHRSHQAPEGNTAFG